MKTASTLFSTVSLIVLLGALSSQLNAMQNSEQTEEKGTTVSVKSSDKTNQDLQANHTPSRKEIEEKVRDLLEMGSDALTQKLQEDPTPEENALTRSVIEYKEETMSSNPTQGLTNHTDEDVQKVIEKVQKTTWAQSLGNAAWWLTLPVSGPLTGLYYVGSYFVGGKTTSPQSIDLKDVQIVRKDDVNTIPVKTEEIPQNPTKEEEVVDPNKMTTITETPAPPLQKDTTTEESADLKQNNKSVETSPSQHQIVLQDSPSEDFQPQNSNPFVDSHEITKPIVQDPYHADEDELNKAKTVGNDIVEEKSSGTVLEGNPITTPKSKNQKKKERQKLKKAIQQKEQENKILLKEVDALKKK